MVSHLFIQGVPVECINQAAITYFVPAKIIISVLKTEGGRPGLVKENNNGTSDFGPMQINTTWLSKVARYGVSAQQLKTNACVNVMVGTWILSQAIAKAPSYWRGIGNYHSHTWALNQSYQHHVLRQLQVLQAELSHVE